LDLKRIFTTEARTWSYREPFAISREVNTEIHSLIATIVDETGRRGRGESVGVIYAGETPSSMAAQLEGVRDAVERGVERSALCELLPAGGARDALDKATWDLAAKRSGRSAFAMSGIERPRPVHTAYTIGIREIDAYRRAAAQRSNYSVLKIKVNDQDPIKAIAAAREGAPRAKLIVDPNQAWSLEQLRRWAPELVPLGVVLLEQPIAIGDEVGLDDYRCPIPLCADELVNDCSDLVKAKGRFDVINIKLEKCGGLTEGLRLAAAARELGFDLMIGCMGGSSLAMAPGILLAQQCAFVDLDSPLLLTEDWPDGLKYKDGMVELPGPAFWGGP
jgi:L-alanine-DL-glutamate epimerase-like enolase superfamily enzyme